jgi:dimethylargininase
LSVARHTRAIVRPPSANFAQGLTSATEGAPDLALALEQHEAYCRTLREAGLEVMRIDSDGAHPDDTFVEDTAVLCARGAVVTRPGAPSRRGEVESVASSLRAHYRELLAIEAPGTVDGGDVCEAGDQFLIGVSARTNEHGARQLARHLERLGYGAIIVDIRPLPGLLHLKTGIAYLGAGIWLVAEEVVQVARTWAGLDMRNGVAVPREEAYAANCVRVNDTVLLARGYPRVARTLRDLGRSAVPLEMSEFRKMDGGLSCLSLRF